MSDHGKKSFIAQAEEESEMSRASSIFKLNFFEPNKKSVKIIQTGAYSTNV